MGFFILLLFVLLIWLWSNVSDLSGRVTRLNEQLAAAKELMATLAARVRQLERGRVQPILMPEPAPADEPTPVVAPQPFVEPPPLVAPPAVIPPPLVVVSPPVVASPPIVGAPPAVEPPPVVAPASGLFDAPPVPAAAAAKVRAERAESWEMTVGTSWFNKIGVLVFIIGVALLVAYSFNHIGPHGRVAIGLALSFGMLGGGVVLERRAAFRNYAYGLVAGGWAGVYFTTFAMHDVPAAKIIDNPVTAVILLSAVAAGMIGHSLRYRSQVVTSLAFVVAYTTLALSPVSGFSLAASVPLAIALLLVSQRFGWAGVSALGIVATYGAFALRGAIFADGVLNPDSALPYVMLATYWLTFEAADIAGLRSRARSASTGSTSTSTSTPVPMLALNATGFMGALMLTVPRDNPDFLAVVLFSAASAYAASAVLRAWLLPHWRARHAADEPFDSTHGASAIAAALFAVAIDIRFAGNRETLALLLEAQLLITAGLTLGDVWLRRFGSIGVALAAGHAWQSAAEFGAGAPIFSWSVGTTSAVILLIAAACYGNREAVHRRSAQPVWLEGAFTWIAAALAAGVFILELDPAHQAIAGLALATLLLEVGFRRSTEYIYQSYVVGGLASYAMLAAFLAPPTAAGMLATWGAAPTGLDARLVLPAGVLLTALAAWRLSRRTGDAAVPGCTVAAAAAAAVSTVLLMVFEWRVLAPHAVAPAWALTALGLVALGAWRRLAVLRWQAYAVSLAATVRAVSPLIDGSPEAGAPTVAIALVIAAVYAIAYVGRRALTPVAAASRLDAGESLEGATLGALSVVATASLVIFKWRVLPELLVAPAWALTGLILVALGIRRSRLGQRWQGYALLTIGSVRVMQSLLDLPLSSLDATSSVALWAAVVIGATYAGAWLVRRASTLSEDPAGALLPILGTLSLAVLQSRVLPDVGLGPAWTATGVVLLALGLWRGASDLRWQSYALLAIGALRTGQPVFGTPDTTTTAIVWLGVVIAALYACGLVVRRMTRAAGSGGRANPAEDIVGTGLLLGATTMLATVILQEVRPSMVTLALGLQGLGLMFSGLIARERVMRLSGLGLLLGCILKLFVYDLREREAIERIVSFVFLGLFLLAISWTYTRYREQIKKFL